MSSRPRRPRGPSRLRDHFSTSAIILSVIALVFALMGGAYAATQSATHKKAAKGLTKAQVLALIKANPGPAGPKGDAGPAGTGSAGPSGSAGPQGPEGNGVVLTSAKLSDCPNGGTNVKAKNESGPGTNICTGKEGSPWTDGSALPPGALETGVWSLHGTEAENPSVNAPISLPIALSPEALNESGVLERSHIHVLSADPEQEQDFIEACLEGTQAGSSSYDPKAAPGEMCVWPSEGAAVNASVRSIVPFDQAPTLPEGEGIGPTGGLIYATMTGTGRLSGTFAVRGCAGTTGPNACP